jgi:hypothetical protein
VTVASADTCSVVCVVVVGRADPPGALSPRMRDGAPSMARMWAA